MGCDIHAHIEVKFKDNEEWQHLANPRVERNYNLFALMAGVRNYDEIVPISDPKGLPKDITDITKISYNYWDLDAHDVSWLGVEELVEIENQNYLWRNDKNMGWLECVFHTFLFSNSLTGWYRYNENPQGVEDLRVVFWFDN